MAASTGVMDPNYARATVIDDGAGTRVALVSIDAIGANGAMMDMAWEMAAARGFTCSAGGEMCFFLPCI
jgi:hypothetical protein